MSDFGRAIYIGLGANLPHLQHGSPRETLLAALGALSHRGIHAIALSPWYRTAPVPASDQPWYVNAVARVETPLPPPALLAELHAVEAEFGRVRSVANAARLIDLDLLDFGAEVSAGGEGKPSLPHPRLTERAFVLLPLADLDPDWRHPVTGVSIRDLIAALPKDQIAHRL